MAIISDSVIFIPPGGLSPCCFSDRISKNSRRNHHVDCKTYYPLCHVHRTLLCTSHCVPFCWFGQYPVSHAYPGVAVRSRLWRSTGTDLRHHRPLPFQSAQRYAPCCDAASYDPGALRLRFGQWTHDESSHRQDDNGCIHLPDHRHACRSYFRRHRIGCILYRNDWSLFIRSLADKLLCRSSTGNPCPSGSGSVTVRCIAACPCAPGALHLRVELK